jgi:hypothetical protein
MIRGSNERTGVSNGGARDAGGAYTSLLLLLLPLLSFAFELGLMVATGKDGKDGRTEGRQAGRQEGRQAGRKEGRQEGRRTEGREARRQEGGREEGRKEGQRGGR